jgi:hypothetical protein
VGDCGVVYGAWWQDRPEGVLSRGGGACCEPPFRRLFLIRIQSKKCVILRATGNAAVAKGAACI